jgi:hypothetical protein
MRIEIVGPPRYQGLDLVKSREWQYWHHLFNARQLMLAAQIRSCSALDMPFALGQVLNVNARLTRWNPSPGPGRAGATSTVFYNQALNTVFNYGCRASAAITSFLPTISGFRLGAFPIFRPWEDDGPSRPEVLRGATRRPYPGQGVGRGRKFS